MTEERERYDTGRPAAERAERDTVRRKLMAIVAEWHRHDANGLDVLALNSLQRLIELAESLKP